MSNHIETLEALKVRKIVTAADEIRMEGGREAEPVPVKAVACAVFQNPWAGQGFVADLWESMNWVGRILSQELGNRVAALVGGPDRVAGFGKAALVGLNGELEHGAGILHGPHLGPLYRETVGGTAGISAIELRTGAGRTVTIPTNHKTHRATRSFYQSVDFTLHDAPHPDEIAIALVAVSGPRVHARAGDLTTDKAWLAGEPRELGF